MKFPSLKTILVTILFCIPFPSQASAADTQIITITEFPNGKISYTIAEDNENNIISGSFGAWPPECFKKDIYRKDIYRAYRLMSEENLNTIVRTSKNGGVTYSLKYESEAPLFSQDSCE